MDLGLISVRYARALLKAATDAKEADKVYRDMQTLAESYIKEPELRFTIDNPMLSKNDKLALLLTAAGGKSSPLTKTFFQLALKEGREKIAQFMAVAFIDLYRKKNNLIRAKLTTATAVTATAEKKLRQLVESMTKGAVEFETEIKPEIVGGFVLEYDTYRMDASVRSQLQAALSQLK